MPRLFATVVVPLAVAAETRSVERAKWLVELPFRGRFPDWLGAAGLGLGETEAIALALELAPEWLILDERRATRVARTAGLQVVGTVGILLSAKSRGLLPAVRPAIEDLLGTGFHLAAWVVADALAEAGEE